MAAIAISAAVHASFLATELLPASLTQIRIAQPSGADWLAGRKSDLKVWIEASIQRASPGTGIGAADSGAARHSEVLGDRRSLTADKNANVEDSAHLLADLAPKYYRQSELDERPRPRNQVEPEFPIVIDPGVTGTVVARLFINMEGAVEKIVIESSRPSGLFDQAVLDAFAKASYTPGKRKGIPVRSQIRVEIDFRSTPLL